MLGLFQGYGIELEYMLVDRESLAVLPVADKVLAAEAGAIVNELERGVIGWSNELALHVIELKTNGPARRLNGVAAQFQHDLAHVGRLANDCGGRLLPTAMHPWMDPFKETRLWPHDLGPIYETFNRIFNCQGHGWSNLQSMHINLPFADDKEFAKLHAAIRVILPILPALAASSPVMDGRVTGLLDNRLDVYQSNARSVPSVSGRVIPEPAFSRVDYEKYILDVIYRDLQPLDPDGILRYEWVNARGAIARFDRNTIEIRVLDVQECPQADLAIAAGVVATLQALVAEAWSSQQKLQQWEVSKLYSLFAETVKDGERAVLRDPAYIRLFGFPEKTAKAQDLWQHLYETVLLKSVAGAEEWEDFWRVYLRHGTLSRRILAATGPAPNREALHRVYERLADCLVSGSVFAG